MRKQIGKSIVIASAIAALGGLTTGGVLAAPPQYSVTALGTLGGDGSYAIAINNSGYVVGGVSGYLVGGVDYYVSLGFIHNGASMTALPTPSGGNSYAWDINNKGQVLVTSASDFNYGTGTPYGQGFLYSGGTMTSLAGSNLGPFQAGLRINDTGQMIGSKVRPYTVTYQTEYTDEWGNTSYTEYSMPAYEYSPFAYDSKAGSNLSLPADIKGVTGINNRGDIIGWTNNYPGTLYNDTGTLLTNKNGTYEATHFTNFDYGLQVQALNDNGVVVVGSINGQSFAVAFQGGLETVLSPMGDRLIYALGINNTGKVVGAFHDRNFESHAFIYGAGQISDLNALIDPSSDWKITEAVDINDLGQIAANGCHAVLGCQALRLDPVGLTIPVPESESYAMLLAGLGLIGAVARRRKSTATSTQ